MLQETLIESLPATSPLTIKRLKLFDIQTYWDLLNHFPFRYEDYSVISPIGKLQEGETVSIKGELKSITQLITKRGFRIQKATIIDSTGKIDLTWFNQKYLLTLLKPGMVLAVGGTVKRFGKALSIDPASYEILQTPYDKTLHTGRIVPIYPEKQGLSSKTIREKVFHIIKTYNDELQKVEFLPEELIKKRNLMPEGEAYSQAHFPDNTHVVNAARKRLGFDELFTMQLSATLVREEWKKEQTANPFKIDAKVKKKIDDFIQNLPFELTNAQKRVTDETLEDLSKSTPMNRFIQGDVGSGKTVVAAIGAYASHLNGYQTLIMAPTAILATQHYNTISKLLEPYGISVGLQTGATKMIKAPTKAAKSKLFDEINNDYDVIIGTQALITQKLTFDRVGLVVIDEQHRFGVAQRAMLKQKGFSPHLMTMTATPIPRTVALTMYGELDLSVIDEMPKGRLPIKTFLTPHDKREKGYEWIKEQMKKDGVQTYIIFPLIEESESETMTSVKAATKEYEYLKKVFKGFNVALLHGKMKAKEKEEVMRDFKDKKYDILVSTSVVEVGIDVPNATIMIIEGAERFGLAQLHQLRGRVGRGDKQSYCFLYTSSEDNENNGRLEFFSNTNSGMRLAEFDLKLRGPGQMYGKSQSGHDELKIASFADFPLISESKHAVDEFMENYKLEDFPGLKKRVEEYQIEQIARD